MVLFDAKQALILHYDIDEEEPYRSCKYETFYNQSDVYGCVDQLCCFEEEIHKIARINKVKVHQ